MTSVNPVQLYESMLSGDVHPKKRQGLEIVNTICRERFDSRSGDWSISSIGRESALRGGPGAPSLHQPKLEHYRALIKAWASALEAAHPRQRKRQEASPDAWIQHIDDISSRQMAYMLKKDLERAQSEIRMLKRRLPDGGVVHVDLAAASGQRTATETISPPPSARREMKRFLADFIDNPKRLKEKGFVVQKSGDIIDAETAEILCTSRVVQVMRSIAELTDA